MKNIQLEYPISNDMQVVKDNDNNSTCLELSKNHAKIRRLDITEYGSIPEPTDKMHFANKLYVDAVPLGAYSKTLIKIHPSDFISNDDRASAYAVVEDDTSDILGIRAGHSSVELYAFVKIPDGYKATHVQVLASASTSSAVRCKTFNYETGVTTDLESFDFNTNEDITDVTATTTNDLVIKLSPASISTIIYGSKITIEKS